MTRPPGAATNSFRAALSVAQHVDEHAAHSDRPTALPALQQRQSLPDVTCKVHRLCATTPGRCIAQWHCTHRHALACSRRMRHSKTNAPNEFTAAVQSTEQTRALHFAQQSLHAQCTCTPSLVAVFAKQIAKRPHSRYMRKISHSKAQARRTCTPSLVVGSDQRRSISTTPPCSIVSGR